MLLKFLNSLWRQCTRKCARESHSSAHNMINSTVNRRSNNRKYSTSRRNTTINNLHKSNSIRVNGDNSMDPACSDINSKLLANTPELLAYCLSVSTPLHPSLGLTDYILALLWIRNDLFTIRIFFVLPNHSGIGSCSDPGVNYAK
jgi:hypothetical protein